MRILYCLVLIAGVSIAGSAGAADPQPTSPQMLRASALLAGRSGSTVTGTATFKQEGDTVTVQVHVMGASPGKHGLHLHETGDCGDPEFKSAGAHFNPAGAPHGAPGDARHHAGDFGNIEIDANGHGMFDFSSTAISLAPGPNSVVGKSIIVHEQADDLKTQPAGDSGERIACGVVRARPPR